MAELSTTALASDAALKLYYRMESNSTDSSASANNGVDTSMTYASGTFGSAAVFSGTGSRILTTNNVGLTSTAHSVSFWFKRNGELTGLFTIFDSKQANNTSGETHIRIYAGSTIGTQTFRFDLTKVGTSEIGATATGTWFDNAYHHCVVTRNAGGIEIFIDNVSRGTASSGTTDAITDGKFVIGEKSSGDANNPSNPAIDIDDFAIFNKVLSTTEISTLYTAGVSGFLAFL